MDIERTEVLSRQTGNIIVFTPATIIGGIFTVVKQKGFINEKVVIQYYKERGREPTRAENIKLVKQVPSKRDGEWGLDFDSLYALIHPDESPSSNLFFNKVVTPLSELNQYKRATRSLFLDQYKRATKSLFLPVLGALSKMSITLATEYCECTSTEATCRPPRHSSSRICTPGS